MSERCRTDCPIWLLSKGHVVCSPLVKQAVEERVFRFMDNRDEADATEVGSLTSGVIDAVDERTIKLDAHLEQVAQLCEGSSVSYLGSRLILRCNGFDENALEAILDTQEEMIKRLGTDA